MFQKSFAALLNPSLVFFFILLQVPAAFSQSGQLPARKKLAVTDFTGQTDERSNYLARTYTIISLRYAAPVPCPADKSKVQLIVQTGNRLSEKSWLKADRVKNKIVLADLLSHEQGHYDIGEAFALELKSKLSGTCLDKGNYKAAADSLFKAMNKRYDALQQQYDTETNNMLNREMQLRWKQKIEALLIEKTSPIH